MSKPGFYDYNRTRSFPFLENTVSLTNQTVGTVGTLIELPDDAIVDCGFVLGPSSEFDTASDSVYLKQVRQVGNTIFFDFGCTAAKFSQSVLTFSRAVNLTDKFVTEHVESELATAANLSCGEPLWSGYMVSGDLRALVSVLNQTPTLTRQDSEAVVERSLLQNLSNTMLVSINTANDDRTRVQAVTGCPDIPWLHPVGETFVNQKCIRGTVKLQSGFNAVITQSDASNTITIGASVGAGLGEPCNEVPLFDGEQPPEDSANALLSGGYLCNETLRSLNGLGGPKLTLLSGQGTTISADPANHKITVDFNLIDLIRQPVT